MLACTGAAALVAAYCGSSWYLMKNPSMLHGKRQRFMRTSHPMASIAHRGGSAERTENTISAFRHATDECHVDMLELDVWLTADKKVVVVHDRNLSRLTGEDIDVTQCNYSDLPKLLRTCPPDHPCHQIADEEERIPLFEEILSTFPSVPLHVDVKESNSTETVKMVAEMLRRYGRENDVIAGSFDRNNCRAFRKERIPTFCSLSRVAALFLSFYIGLLPFLPISEVALDIPYGEWYYKRISHRISSLVSIAVGPAWGKTTSQAAESLLRKMGRCTKLFRHLQERGVSVYFWTLDSDGEFREALNLGVDGVMTDCPSALQSFLEKGGSKTPNTQQMRRT